MICERIASSHSRLGASEISTRWFKRRIPIENMNFILNEDVAPIPGPMIKNQNIKQ